MFVSQENCPPNIFLGIFKENQVLVSFSIFGSDRSSRKANLSACVRSFGPSLSRAVNLHHSGSNLQAISQE